MENLYQPTPAKILNIKLENKDTKLFRLLVPKHLLNFQPGQFIMVNLPGFGEAPFAICSKPGEKFLEICVRKVGQVTTGLHRLKPGEKIFVRGPYGKGVFGVNSETRNFLLVGGGTGIIPLRAMILKAKDLIQKGKKIQVFYGVKTQSDFIFKDEYNRWRKYLQLEIIVEKPSFRWKGKRGLITQLFDEVKILPESSAWLCGPPAMYKFVIQKMKQKGFKDKDIFLSLERRMHCGIGICQHCAIGSVYVCKDGPVFNYEKLKPEIF